MKVSYVILPTRKKTYWEDLFENTVNDTIFYNFFKVVYVIPPPSNNK